MKAFLKDQFVVFYSYMPIIYAWNHLPTWIFEVFSTHLTEIFNNQTSAEIMPNSVWCLTWGVHTPWYVIKAFSLSEFHKKKKYWYHSFVHTAHLHWNLLVLFKVLYNGTLSSYLYPAADKHFSLPPHHTSLLDLSASLYHSQQTLHKYISSTRTKYTSWHQIDTWKPYNSVH